MVQIEATHSAAPGSAQAAKAGRARCAPTVRQRQKPRGDVGHRTPRSRASVRRLTRCCQVTSAVSFDGSPSPLVLRSTCDLEHPPAFDSL
ncbi:hypothetical protein G7K_0360-t1 [Saitoella complicata NRRL Y-17804]|uniref:Uncharacterized protein n=1 Tax=Saitoella complicata (strain BCRC 22490 / CBS 7301 / JCM 7358 / NBRC 10748 / NRRL Y-17804) TaxID=698492 RepID=A0A0E9N9N4_SAICN|nr:hypothetical protein G7K_0360-t1 [Saitoella complicata NRRL Y-17804]